MEIAVNATVSFKPSKLSFSDWIQLAAVARYPRSVHPIATWLVRESAFIAFFAGVGCALVGFVASPKFSTGQLSAWVIPCLIVIWFVFLMAGLKQSYRSARATGPQVVELSEDGICVRNENGEWRIRWRPEFRIGVAGDFIFIKCRTLGEVWIPRDSFASPEAADEFVLTARTLQTLATGGRIDGVLGS